MAQIASFRSVCLIHVKNSQQHTTAAGSPVKRSHSFDRRHAVLSSVLGVAACFTPRKVSAIPLAPLGKRTDKVGGDKLEMPTVDQVKARLTCREVFTGLLSFPPCKPSHRSAAGCIEKRLI